jgi:hypothetical protein
MRVFDTPLGRMAVAATSRGLARVLLPNEMRAIGTLSAVRARPRKDFNRRERGERRERILWFLKTKSFSAFSAFSAVQSLVEREILQYLAGRRRKFTVPVDLSAAEHESSKFKVQSSKCEEKTNAAARTPFLP